MHCVSLTSLDLGLLRGHSNAERARRVESVHTTKWVQRDAIALPALSSRQQRSATFSSYIIRIFEVTALSHIYFIPDLASSRNQGLKSLRNSLDLVTEDFGWGARCAILLHFPAAIRYEVQQSSDRMKVGELRRGRYALCGHVLCCIVWLAWFFPAEHDVSYTATCIAQSDSPYPSFLLLYSIQIGRPP